MFRRSTALVTSLVMLASMGTGCIGNFGLSGEVRKFNLKTTEDRWGREILFVILYVIPVYGIAGLLDIIIFNSIEFWTGKNPINGSKSVTPISMRTFVAPDGTSVAMQHMPDDSIDVSLTSPEGLNHYVNLTRTDDGITARDEAGNLIIRSKDLSMEQIAALEARI